MASISQQIIGNVEAVYGRLGDAQIEMLQKLIAEKPSLKEYSEMEIWQAVNRKLAANDYRPAKTTEENEHIMDKLFKSGENYPDIFSTNPEDVDMNDFM